MTLKQYFPISVGIFVAVCAACIHYSVPIAPFAGILLVGETLLGFQLEDHKAPRLLKQVLTPAKPHQK